MSVEARLSFDGVASLYDKARPTYPGELFDDLKALCQIGGSSSIVEVGCGTGQASVPLTRMCGKLTCVELGANLARVASENLAGFPNARVQNAPFEGWDAKGERFDVLFCATAWHWLDPDRRYPKAHEVLKERGHLALVTNSHAFPADIDPFFLEIDKTYREIGEGWDKPRPTPENQPDESKDILASGLFRDVEVRRYLWSAEYTGEELVNLLSTYSDHIAWPQEKRNRLFEGVRRLAGDRKVRKHYLTILHVATSGSQPGSTPR